MKKLTNTGKQLIILSLAFLASSLIVLTPENFETVGANFGENQPMPALSGKNAIEHLKENGQFESLAEALTTARYEAESSGAGASAINYANQIRGTFSPAGFLLETTSANGERVQSRWRPENLGYGDAQLTIGDGIIETTGSRITIKRQLKTDSSLIPHPSSFIEEWFNNTPNGLEHGFTLPERLSETSRNLRLTIAVEGDLTAQADADGQNLKLVNNQGEAILKYEKLKVWDADGVEIAAWMRTENGAVILEIEEAAAKYPLTIDPTFSMAAKLTANDGAEFDVFGSSVAISFDTVIIGAKTDDIGSDSDQGSAYVFVRGANGLWTQQAKLNAVDGAAGDRFGESVAISGDTVVVGAFEDDIGANPNVGSAYVYTRSGTTWTFQQKLTASDGTANDFFGGSVAISGETIVVGAGFASVGSIDEVGAAYVFVRNGTVWTQQQKLRAADDTGGDQFGNSVALSGNTAIVGAHLDNFNGNIFDQGAAYIFTRSGTTWSQQAKLQADDGAADDYFGTSVAISTPPLSFTTVIIGAIGDDISGNDQGSAYIFTRSGTTWTQEQKLSAAGGAEDERFGTSVGISGGTVIIGAINAFIGGANRGAAYIFTRSGTTWTERQRLIPFDANPGDNFGNSVAIFDDTAIIGMELDDLGPNDNQGSAYIFRRGNKPFDFDEDGKTDLGIFRPAPGEWWINRSANGSTFAAQFGQTSDKIVPADFTGDGKTDVAFWRPSTGQWFVLRSEDFSYYAFPFGASGDIPAPGDFDSDGRADAAVFRPSTATWYIQKSSGGTDILGFGAANDKPTVADYDGDGKADIAIFRPNGATGAEWWIRRSSGQTVFALQFGISTDKPVQGDYTGDGKADVAFWRPSSGFWFILRSEDFSFYSFPFGTSGDLSAPGDYDDDAKFDAAVFRPSDSTWYVNKSSGGTLIQQFGIAGDVPLPSAFVP